ncbi:MAG: hypothetical protein WA126_01475 [Thermodesulfovibrionales bacterium]
MSFLDGSTSDPGGFIGEDSEVQVKDFLSSLTIQCSDEAGV